MRSLIVAVALFAVPAFATGERVVVNTASESLKESICVSMACVASGPRDAVVSTRAVRGGIEVTVRSASGGVKLVHLMRANGNGDVSSIEVMRTSSLVLKAIESPRPLKLARR